MGSHLSSEHLAQLTPLLGSLARLVAGGSQLSEREIRTLLLGVDLATNPAAMSELRLWGTLLHDLQQAPDATQRRATVEALLLRGLPEAPVLLAVATVAGSGTPVTPPPVVGTTISPPLPACLHASMTNLDFGILLPGQTTTLEFDVQGGPGHVVVENDHVQVAPMQFGGGTTRLRVGIKPLASGLLFTRLKLVTAGETLEVPIMAQWQDGGTVPAQIVLDPLGVPPAPTRQAPQPIVVPPPQPPVAGREMGMSPVTAPPKPTAVPRPRIVTPATAPVVAPQPQSRLSPTQATPSARSQSPRRRLTTRSPSNRAMFGVVILIIVGIGLLFAYQLQKSSVATAVAQAATATAVAQAAAATAATAVAQDATTIAGLPPWAPAIVKIPAGPFLMGSNDSDLQADSDESPQHTLTLPAYWIGTTEVTNAQFRPFVEGDGYTNATYWTARGWAWQQSNAITEPGCWNESQWNGANQPVVCVSWYEAVAYCRWLSVQTGMDFRLPTEAEWEKAARGPNGLIYPWGNTWEMGRANSEEANNGETTMVGTYPSGANYYGILDVAGNVWEWTATVWGKSYPYQIEDEWQPSALERSEDRTIRGGSWMNNLQLLRGAYRVYNAMDYRSQDDGFRVASHHQ